LLELLPELPEERLDGELLDELEELEELEEPPEELVDPSEYTVTLVGSAAVPPYEPTTVFAILILLHYLLKIAELSLTTHQSPSISH